MALFILEMLVSDLGGAIKGGPLGSGGVLGSGRFRGEAVVNY